jgi:hypothetical protein
MGWANWGADWQGQLEGQRGADGRGQKAVWIPLNTCELTVNGNISATDEKIIFLLYTIRSFN